jgi:hypothetical protein
MAARTVPSCLPAALPVSAALSAQGHSCGADLDIREQPDS